jgi:protocatechuate 3,4-dioxygenase beta subunit
MAKEPLVRIERRGLVIGAAASAVILVAKKAIAAATLVATPGQTEGPFYPLELPPDIDNDLVKVTGQAAIALGQVTHIAGRVINARGQAIPGAQIEIWQCDANGVYRHPRAPGQARIDHGFQGYGRTQVDSNGAYSFRTIRPVAYPGRTPHIHFAVHVPGRGRLVTQMYVEGEPLNARDGVLNSIRDPQARQSVIVPLRAAPHEQASLQGEFNIVIGS